MDTKELLMKLSAAAGVTGVDDAMDVLETALSNYARAVRDDLGGISAVMDFQADTTVLLDAHLDEIGLVVTGIDDQGFVHVAKSGGVDIRALLAQEVVIHAKEPLFGVFSCPVPHLSKDERTMPPLEKMAIDVGYSKEEAEKRIRIGDRISFRQHPVDLLGNRITGKSLDNRAGVAALLRTAELLTQQDGYGVNVAFAFSAQEEVGCRGAKTIAYGIFPEEAVVVDVSFGDSADIPEHRSGKLDGGVMIGVSPTLNKPITDRLISLAKTNHIPYQLEGMGGNTSTNADVISLTKTGVPCGLLSIPLRYMHTAVETISLADIESTAQLLFRYLMERGNTK